MKHSECILTVTFSLPATSPLTRAICSFPSIRLSKPTILNVPLSVGILATTSIFISCSVFFLYLIKSAIVIIFKLCFLAKISKSGTLAIVPSSFKISHITATGVSPQILHKSTVASVCPSLSRTPLSFAINGKICPGLVKSLATELISANFLIVVSLSAIEIPVVVLSFASTDTVKAVHFASVFLALIGSKFNLTAYSVDIGVQVKPLANVAIRLILS